MIAALTSREAITPVNRKRVQRLMREHALLQPQRSEGRRRRPGFFQVTRPDELWHLDMTSVWVAEHGWCYLNAAIDCCTREIAGWALDVRCRAAEATAVIDDAVAERGIRASELTLGTDNGTAYTSRAFRARLAEHGIAHRRGGYRDPASQAFIESWSSKLKQRRVWREEFETLEQARAVIGADDGYHHRPHSGLAYRTPREVAATWKERRPVNPSGLSVNADGVQASDVVQAGVLDQAGEGAAGVAGAERRAGDGREDRVAGLAVRAGEAMPAQEVCE
jgi:putative transposase